MVKVHLIYNTFITYFYNKSINTWVQRGKVILECFFYVLHCKKKCFSFNKHMSIINSRIILSL